MNPFQPWQDTTSLLVGARPPRSARPGEQFEIPQKRRRFTGALLTRVLLILRVALH